MPEDGGEQPERDIYVRFAAAERRLRRLEDQFRSRELALYYGIRKSHLSMPVDPYSGYPGGPGVPYPGPGGPGPGGDPGPGYPGQSDSGLGGLGSGDSDERDPLDQVAAWLYETHC